MATGAVIGAVYAMLFNYLGMQSFVSTLAGLLAILGMQLYILGATGSINLPYGSPLVSFGQLLVMPHIVAYAVGALAGIAAFVMGYRKAVRRRAAGLSSQSLGHLLTRAIVLTIVLELV